MFFYVLIFLTILLVLFVFLKIKINIQNIKISTEKPTGRIIDKNYKITILLYAFGKIPTLKVDITKEKLEKFRLKNKLKGRINRISIESLKNAKINKKKLRKIKKAKPQIERIKLLATIGTEDAALTSYIVAVISGIIGILLRKQISYNSKNKFIITPVFINKNLLNLELDCIFTIKMIHIIYIIYILRKKRRDDKNVRTSHRRSYGYSYE